MKICLDAGHYGKYNLFRQMGRTVIFCTGTCKNQRFLKPAERGNFIGNF